MFNTNKYSQNYFKAPWLNSMIDDVLVETSSAFTTSIILFFNIMYENDFDENVFFIQRRRVVYVRDSIPVFDWETQKTLTKQEKYPFVDFEEDDKFITVGGKDKPTEEPEMALEICSYMSLGFYRPMELPGPLYWPWEFYCFGFCC